MQCCALWAQKIAPFVQSLFGMAYCRIVFGSLIGSFFGALIAIYLTDIIYGIEAPDEGINSLADIYFVNFLPSELMISDVLLVSLTAIILSLLTSSISR